ALLQRADGLARAAGALRRDNPGRGPVSSWEHPLLAPMAPAWTLQGRVLWMASARDLLPGGAGVPAGESGSARRPGEDEAAGAQLLFEAQGGRLAEALSALLPPEAGTLERWAAGCSGSADPVSVGTLRMEREGLHATWSSCVSLAGLGAALLSPLDEDEDLDPAPDAAGAAPFIAGEVLF
ncbi:MAG TPA: hypothetical protein VJV23_11070, partial [Candidatus Polarisedimenticolia bacterium]|nr:hypothetical protein [Candidatus Polarisedimenticolia bacterium]